ncbi:MAG TPA: FtsX-like permease family protein [Nitrospiria bacterium]|nr:FtsX-like permease family protein [Nitrospiria bacterium]
MKHLFRLVTFRMVFLSPLQSALTLLGVSLGVAVFVAILITNRSILTTYTRSVELLTGKATLTVTSDERGFNEESIRAVRGTEGVLASSPIVETAALIKEGKGRGDVLWILGVDLLEEDPFRHYEASVIDPDGDPFSLLTRPDTLFVTERFARRHGVSVGDSLMLSVNHLTRRLIVRGLLGPIGPALAEEGNIALMDIASAQWIFGKVGRLDRIDLLTSPGGIEEVASRLRAKLPSSISIDRPESRSRQVERMLSAFQLNLTALSSISLFVAFFLIYNTLSFSLARRRREIGLLRTIGATERELFHLYLSEGIGFGLLGGIFGVALGYLFAHGALEVVSTTVTSLYLWIPRERVTLNLQVLIEGIGIGVGVALFASLLPVRSATRVPPREALDGVPPLSSSPPRKLFWGGFLLLAATYPLSLLPDWRGLPLFGYLAAFFLFIGFTLVTPFFLNGFGRFLFFFFRHGGPEARLALDHSLRNSSRTGSAVAALMVSLAMLIGVVILIVSFRTTVELWIDQTVTADLIGAPVTSLFHQGRGVEAPDTLSEKTLSQLEQIDGVAAVDGYRSLSLLYRGERTILAGRDLGIHHRFSRFLFASENGSDPIALAIERHGALISEVMANRFGLKVGESLTLSSPSGPVTLPIEGIFYDYSTEGGKIIVDRTLLKALWRDTDVNVAAIYLRPGAEVEAVRQRLISSFGGEGAITFITHVGFKKEVLKIFDQTFMITYALEGVAILVAVLGIVNALLTSILDRRREIGIVRAIGAGKRQLLKMILYEAGFLGLAGYLLGLLCGLFLSLVLIFVINRQSFGWTIRFIFPLKMIPEWFGLVFLTSLAASLFPAGKLLRQSIREATAYE